MFSFEHIIKASALNSVYLLQISLFFLVKAKYFLEEKKFEFSRFVTRK
jgi:hypothetical protein